MIIKTIWENNVEIFYTGNPRFFDNLFLELAIALRIQTSIARERAANASNAGHYYFRATMNGKRSGQSVAHHSANMPNFEAEPRMGILSFNGAAD